MAAEHAHAYGRGIDHVEGEADRMLGQLERNPALQELMRRVEAARQQVADGKEALAVLRSQLAQKKQAVAAAAAATAAVRPPPSHLRQAVEAGAEQMVRNYAQQHAHRRG